MLGILHLDSDYTEQSQTLNSRRLGQKELTQLSTCFNLLQQYISFIQIPSYNRWGEIKSQLSELIERRRKSLSYVLNALNGYEIAQAPIPPSGAMPLLLSWASVEPIKQSTASSRRFCFTFSFTLLICHAWISAHSL